MPSSPLPEDNPFRHRLNLTALDKLQIAVMSVTVAPLRIAAMFICFMSAWLSASVSLAGHDTSKPMTGWRRAMRPFVIFWARATFFFFGFHWVTVRGKRASVKEAAILTLAPHTGYFDSLVVVFLDMCAVVTRSKTEETPFFGTMTKFTQPIFVHREDPNSRVNTIQGIKDRANSNGEWPQILIYPEGTCTNATVLISYKLGAFYPGVPVQPVAVKYTNKMNSVIWTWDGPTAMTAFWVTLCQFHTGLELNFLPVYTPSADEISNPPSFANNVRHVTADALCVQTTNATYEDCSLRCYLRKHRNVPAVDDVLQVFSLCKLLNIETRNNDKSLAMLNKIKAMILDKPDAGYEQFIEEIDIKKCSESRQLFNIFANESHSKIDLSKFALTMHLLIRRTEESQEISSAAMEYYDRNGSGYLDKSSCIEMLRNRTRSIDVSSVSLQEKSSLDSLKETSDKKLYDALFTNDKEDCTILETIQNISNQAKKIA